MRSTSDRATPVAAPFTALALGAFLALGAVACGPADSAPPPGEDHAVVHVSFQATGAGEFIGHDIDGREVRASELILFTMQDGQIREYTYEWDELGFWAQLGIIDVSPSRRRTGVAPLNSTGDAGSRENFRVPV